MCLDSLMLKYRHVRTTNTALPETITIARTCALRTPVCGLAVWVCTAVLISRSSFRGSASILWRFDQTSCTVLGSVLTLLTLSATNFGMTGNVLWETTVFMPTSFRGGGGGGRNGCKSFDDMLSAATSVLVRLGCTSAYSCMARFPPQCSKPTFEPAHGQWHASESLTMFCRTDMSSDTQHALPCRVLKKARRFIMEKLRHSSVVMRALEISSELSRKSSTLWRDAIAAVSLHPKTSTAVFPCTPSKRRQQPSSSHAVL
mmetsp:Transcript_30182/g.89559  ORF Transcript_30182/g.89559 Transcript_30182/m.89559 type:complete len:259 (-) Transcript_30182:905-1681(-)